MLQQERYEKILFQVQSKGAVKVTRLAKELTISESTIRRDIIELDHMGKLKKVFGGAVSCDTYLTSKETDVKTRAVFSVIEKDSIAKHAASLIEANDFVFIDAGTTTAKLIDFLPDKAATYVTNGLSHALALTRSGHRVYLLGGKVNASTEAVTGTEALAALTKYNFTKCFLGTNAVDLEHGFTTPNLDEATVKTHAAKRSSIVYVLADSRKFETVAPVTFLDIESAWIITDKLGNEEYKCRTEVIETESE
ncbi:DeoR/GlpR family DNA-binding transcription regulator [Anoxynatronum sibiricum]|uniref:DeoR/GlpR family DNA-binding transcription regulator n=1 Tax=Anoxynatronum sibiricum TaxID=210623 RepID=A0ABU9VP05_9CLOT